MPWTVSLRRAKAKTAASAAMIPKEITPWMTSPPIAKAREHEGAEEQAERAA